VAAVRREELACEALCTRLRYLRQALDHAHRVELIALGCTNGESTLNDADRWFLNSKITFLQQIAEAEESLAEMNGSEM